MSTSELHVGMQVDSREGEPLGTVTQVLGDYFKVRGEHGQEHWFPRSHVVQTADGRAHAGFSRSEVSLISVPAPDTQGDADHIEPERRTAEQDAQRQQVLRELSEQRQELREAASRGARAAASGRLDSALDNAADILQGTIRRAYSRAPAQGSVEDVLRGKWLGHPLHPLLTDAVGAGLTMCALFDTLEAVGVRGLNKASDVSLGFAIASMVPTALAGSADWQHAEGRARRLGVLHISVNTMVSLFSLASLVARIRHRRRAGRVWGLAAFAGLNVGAYLGGEMVYDEGMSVAQ